MCLEEILYHAKGLLEDVAVILIVFGLPLLIGREHKK